LQHHWARLVLGHWNSMVSMPDSLCHLAFCDDIRMAVERKVGWTHKVFQFLDALGFRRPRDLLAGDAVAHYSALQLPVDAILDAMARSMLAHWRADDLSDADPRTYDGEASAHVCRYGCYMGGPDYADNKVAAAPHVYTVMPAAAHISLMRFRLCAWSLEANRPAGRVRAARVCRMCAHAGRPDQQEDEMHVAIECPCYASLRLQYPDLPFADGMFALMYSQHQASLGPFLQAVHHCRENLIKNLQTT